jgi:hypothetical protein
MKRVGRLIGLAAGVATGAWGFNAAAEPNDGVTVEFSASAAQIDLMGLEGYGRRGQDDQTGVPLLEQQESEAGTRFDARVSGFDWNVFGQAGSLYLRGAYQSAEGGASVSVANDDVTLIPTGLEGFDQAQFIGLGAGGAGTILVDRTLEQTEAEIAAGFVFETELSFKPRIEFTYRRGEIDQTITVDLVGVTPMLEQSGADTSALNSDCAELGLGVAKIFPLSGDWSFVADASAGVGYCQHEFEGQFDFIDNINDYSSPFDDSVEEINARGALSGGVYWQMIDALTLGLNAYARAESGAPYIAYPTYEIDILDVESIGVIRIETESRVSYGAGLSLRLALP